MGKGDACFLCIILVRARLHIRKMTSGNDLPPDYFFFPCENFCFWWRCEFTSWLRVQWRTFLTSILLKFKNNVCLAHSAKPCFIASVSCFSSSLFSKHDFHVNCQWAKCQKPFYCNGFYLNLAHVDRLNVHLSVITAGMDLLSFVQVCVYCFGQTSESVLECFNTTWVSNQRRQP